MTFRRDVGRVVRSFTGPLPRGTMLFVDTSEDFIHLEDFQPDSRTVEIKVLVDRPEDDFDQVIMPVVNGAIPADLVPQPKPRRRPRAEARLEVIEWNGLPFVEAVEHRARELVEQCLHTFADNAPGNWCYYSQPSVNLRLDWRASRRNSWGGRTGISIALNGIFPVLPHARCFESFSEYGHIRSDPEIGRFLSNRWEDHLAGLIAHEVAHQIQQSGFFRGGPSVSAAHGEGWQAIYRILRRKIVNPSLD